MPINPLSSQNYNMKINLGIQIAPILEREKGFPIIDECIKMIQDSGIQYTVTPFETVLEGEYEETMKLVDQLYHKVSSLSPETVINMRIHTRRGGDVIGTEKTQKFSS